jgi:hypothetical protein
MQMTTPRLSAPRLSKAKTKRMERLRELNATARHYGGFNRECLALLGVPWPPRARWKDDLLRGHRRSAINQIPPTVEQIEAKRTPQGGWTRETLRQWGVSWPPQKGWKQKLIERREAWERKQMQQLPAPRKR